MAKKKINEETREVVEQEINHTLEHYIDNINQNTTRLVEDLDDFRSDSTFYNWHKLRLSLEQATVVLNNVDNFIGEKF